MTGNAPMLPPSGLAEARPVSAPPGGSRLLGSPAGPRLPAEPASRTVPPRFAGRVVLIYEEQIRRPWRLLVFTAVLVALTIGVVLGQAEAYRPASSRSASTAQVGGDAAPPPSAAIPTPPAPLTAPLGALQQRRLEIAGAATTLRIRTAELGESLFTIAALDQSAVPQLADTGNGSLLTLTPGLTGTVGADVVLNAKVAWTLVLTGGATELDVDSRAGGLVGLELTAGVSRGVLQLAKPKGAVPFTISGSVGELTVRTDAGVPVRVRLGKGAGLATINGKARRGVKAGTALRDSGWSAAEDKYDVRATAQVSTLLVERLVAGR
ncbi:hypothetical protein OHA21_05510 [Actinoplanes sp. NBC_00393]|uniref:hypothetical protein n=1 Tax=Actinoplanes sp. NBC_00393 TaxID=2975953 RepID=UPI002E1DF63C